jgi:hypothetical protein
MRVLSGASAAHGVCGPLWWAMRACGMKRVVSGASAGRSLSGSKEVARATSAALQFRAPTPAEKQEPPFPRSRKGGHLICFKTFAAMRDHFSSSTPPEGSIAPLGPPLPLPGLEESTPSRLLPLPLFGCLRLSVTSTT